METRAAAANPPAAAKAASRDHRLRGYGRLAVILTGISRPAVVLAGIRSLVFIDMPTSELAPADCASRLASGAPWGAAFPRRSFLAPQSRRHRAPLARRAVPP